jgi:uncharacterized protein (DUF2141 family)
MKFLSILIFSGSAIFQNNVSIPTPPNTGTLVVNVSNVKHRGGNIKAVLQNKNNFLTPEYVACIENIPTEDNTQMVFKNLPVGDYSVAIYHDLNSNNLFDRNWFGYPSEPFAVSNNLRPYKLLLPSFNDAKVNLKEGNEIVNINLLNN